ncbi:hypothetical protein MMC06_001328 [Schaereria dolodes]|nr:hypothetical protein [Schaereria dolodes]
MSYALSTTKRKFHRILDSISNSSNTSLSSQKRPTNASTTTLPAQIESPAKKARTTRPQSAYVSSVSQIVPVQAHMPPRPTIRTTEMSIGVEEPKVSNFTPWDRGRFLERLKTFRHVDKWMSKPEEVNEVQWAKRGWTCVGKERVACVGCGRVVVVNLESEEVLSENNSWEADENDWRISAQAQLVETYAEMIISGHEEGCLWRRRGCDGIIISLGGFSNYSLIRILATIYRLPLTHPPSTLEGLQQRYESLVNMSAEIPGSLLTPRDCDSQGLKSQLSPLLSKPLSSAGSPQNDKEQPIKTINEQALIMAFFGWQMETGHIAGLATCNACFRRLGLWLFRSKPDGVEGLDDEGAIMSRLDVIEEHRNYCPWVNPFSQSGDGTPRKGTTPVPRLSGWQMLERLVRSQQFLQGNSVSPTATPAYEVDGDSTNELEIVENSSAGIEDRTTTEVKDKERWVKLRKLKQAFRVKSLKNLRKEKENVSASTSDNAG